MLFCDEMRQKVKWQLWSAYDGILGIQRWFTYPPPPCDYHAFNPMKEELVEQRFDKRHCCGDVCTQQDTRLPFFFFDNTMKHLPAVKNVLWNQEIM